MIDNSQQIILGLFISFEQAILFAHAKPWYIQKPLLLQSCSLSTDWCATVRQTIHQCSSRMIKYFLNDRGDSMLEYISVLSYISDMLLKLDINTLIYQRVKVWIFQQLQIEQSANASYEHTIILGPYQHRVNISNIVFPYSNFHSWYIIIICYLWRLNHIPVFLE